MRRINPWAGLLAWTAAWGLVVPAPLSAQTRPSSAPQPAPAASPSAPSGRGAAAAPKTPDIALEPDGTFRGQAVTAQGAGLSGLPVVVERADFRVDTITGPDGKFAAVLPRGGAYRVQVGMASQPCRMWQAGSAPPSATPGLLMVQDEQLVLGQHCGTPVAAAGAAGAAGARGALSHPLVFGGIVAAAIAIPVAIHNSEDDPAS